MAYNPQTRNIGSAIAPAGSTKVGDDNSYSNFTPTAATVKGALSGIDSALTGAGGGSLKVDGSNSPTANIDWGGFGITNILSITGPIASAISLISGTPVSGSGLGINIVSSSAVTSGGGGNIAITAGNGAGVGAGGNITIATGSGNTTSTPSSLTISAGGNSGGNGRGISITGAPTTNAGSNGGSVTLSGGSGNTTGTSGGTVTVRGGGANASSVGGNVVIAGGTVVSGTPGSILFQTNTVTVMTIDGANNITFAKPIFLAGSTSGTFSLTAANTTSSYAVKAPASQGAANTILTNDGSGNLSWTPSGVVGGVTGPGTSTAFGTAAYADASGTILIDLVLSGRGILAGAGLNPDFLTGISIGDLGLSFAGSAPDEVSPYPVIPLYSPGLSGWKVNPNSQFGIDYMTHYMSGVMLYHTHVDGLGVPNVAFVNSTIFRTDGGASQIGTPQRSFAGMAATTFYFGGESTGHPLVSRRLFMYDTAQSAGGAFPGPGMGFDGTFGSEWYWASVDKTSNHYRENFNLSYDNNITTISAPTRTIVDTESSPSIILKGPDRTGGTSPARAGDLVLLGGTSDISNNGDLFLSSGSGIPTNTPNTYAGATAIKLDSATNSLYTYVSGAWAAVGGGGGGANTTLSNLTSPTAINQDLIFSNYASPVQILAAATTGQALNIAAAANAAGTGGALSLVAGAATTTGNGGALTLASGAANVAAGSGISGVITINTGAANGAGGTARSGAITIQTGTAVGNSGAITIQSGTSSAVSGAITIRAQQGSTTGGAVNINGGNGGTGGALSLGSGQGTGGSNAGALNINGGSANTSGTGGTVTIVGGASATGINGNVLIRGANTANTANAGGTASLLGGTGGTVSAGTGGAVTVQGGQGTTNTSGVGGSILVAGGDATATNGTGGAATIRAGNGASGGSGVGASLTLAGGTGATNGSILFQAAGSTRLSVSSAGLNFFGSTSGTLTIAPAATTTNYAVIMPSAQGTGALTNDGSGNLSWTPSGGGGSSWTKYTYAYTAFSDPGQSKQLTVVALAAKSVVTGVIVKHSQEFTGGTLTGYAISVDSDAAIRTFANDFDVFQTIGEDIYSSNLQQRPIGFTSGGNVLVTADSFGDNLDQATQGSVDIWVKVETLP